MKNTNTAEHIHECDQLTNYAIEETLDATWRYHALLQTVHFGCYQQPSYEFRAVFFHLTEDYEN